ncbi:DAK2 domain-containing protein [candidate division WOR-3 bacterium]|nr:DAK2 domain-containing protein [candidate division WOR-3 bacterium]
MANIKDECQGIFISEIELSRKLLVNTFTGFLERISPRKEEVNEMNYFPVRDSDTGDNLVGTLKGIIRGIQRTDNRPKRELIEELQEEILLDSARGNAGMIFTGWFSGFLDHLRDELVLNTLSLAHAMERGRQSGYKVFAQPKSGTILDPISSCAKTALAGCKKEKNLLSLFDEIIPKVRASVLKTTDRLGVLLRGKNSPEEIHNLEENHVVDAGALGFQIFLESFRKTIVETIWERGGVVVVIMAEEKLKEDLLKDEFAPLGDSLDIRVSPTGKRVAIHIHTDSPHMVADIAHRFSEISEITSFKIEDLAED